jgi:hypothetical protein
MLPGPPAGQVSPDKDVICRYTTAAFTVPPKPGALSCCADLPGGLALYAISVRRLIALRSSFLRTILARSPLLSASILFLSHDSNGFTYRGLTPHKITPMPGVLKSTNLTGRGAGRLRDNYFGQQVVSVVRCYTITTH